MSVKTKKVISEDHKEALKKGRYEGRIVRNYLLVLKETRNSGRSRSIAKIENEINNIESSLDVDDVVVMLKQIQRLQDLRMLLSSKKEISKFDELEHAFITVAKSYSHRHGISKETWKEMGVPARVLRAAGIK